MNFNQQNILDYFGLNTQQELLEYMEENPNDKDVQLLKEISIRLEKEVDSNE